MGESRESVESSVFAHAPLVVVVHPDVSRFPLADESRERLEARLDVRVARVEATRVVRVVRVARVPSELDEVDVVEFGADEDRLDVSGEGSRGVPRGVGRGAAAREGVDGGGEEEVLAAFVREAEPAADALVGGDARVVVVGGEVDEVHPGVVGDRELLERVALVVGRGPRGRGEERVGDEQVAPAEATILAGSTPRLEGRAVAGTRGDGDARADARGPGIRPSSARRRNATTRRDGRHRREMTSRARRRRRATRHARPPSRETPRARRSASRRRAWRRRV